MSIRSMIEKKKHRKAQIQTLQDNAFLFWLDVQDDEDRKRREAELKKRQEEQKRKAEEESKQKEAKQDKEQSSGQRYSMKAERPQYSIALPEDDDKKHRDIRYSRLADKTANNSSFHSAQDRFRESEVDRLMKNLADARAFGMPPLFDHAVNLSFVLRMAELLRMSGKKDSEVYKAAQIDRRLFSKIMSDVDYTPQKDTCIALCFGMKLPLQEATDLLSRAGYALSHSSRRDVVIEYFFREKVYDLSIINEVLYDLGDKPLGK